MPTPAPAPPLTAKEKQAAEAMTKLFTEARMVIKNSDSTLFAVIDTTLEDWIKKLKKAGGSLVC